MMLMQPELNIGIIGHVDHGKTSITFAITGKWTDTHSEELKRGISIKLGYADYSSYRCFSCGNYQTNGGKCNKCGSDVRFLRSISILDAPGHETLMATAIACGNIIDGAILVIAANEQCPQPQTNEHLMILKILGVKKLVVIQNKIDVVSRENALKNYGQIKAFLEANGYPNAPVIPIAARLKINIDKLVEAIEKNIPTPPRDKSKPLRMYVARSFDINRPGSDVLGLKGGILGGSVVSGQIKQGDDVEAIPMPKEYGKQSEIISVKKIFSGNESLEIANPGGLLAVQTGLDPYWTKSDSMLGTVIGKPGTLPSLYDKAVLEYQSLERTDMKLQPFVDSEPLVLNAGTATAVAFVKSVKKKQIEIQLKNKIPIDQSMIIAVSRKVKMRWRLAGYGRLIA